MTDTWTDHDNDGMPATISSNTVVVAQLDGHTLAPLPAGEIDWQHAGDPVLRWRLADPSEATS